MNRADVSLFGGGDRLSIGCHHPRPRLPICVALVYRLWLALFVEKHLASFRRVPQPFTGLGMLWNRWHHVHGSTAGKPNPAMKSSKIIARVRAGAFTHAGPISAAHDEPKSTRSKRLALPANHQSGLRRRLDPVTVYAHLRDARIGASPGTQPELTITSMCNRHSPAAHCHPDG